MPLPRVMAGLGPATHDFLSFEPAGTNQTIT
jgi:hypothetical protein